MSCMTDRVSDITHTKSDRPALALVEPSGSEQARPEMSPVTSPSAEDRTADQIVFKDQPVRQVITDFEDGVDAIDFMIQAFGFEDLDALKGPDNPSPGPGRASMNLVDPHA